MNHFTHPLFLLASVLGFAVLPAEKTLFLIPPEVIIAHTLEQGLIGPGMFVWSSGVAAIEPPRAERVFTELAHETGVRLRVDMRLEAAKDQTTFR